MTRYLAVDLGDRRTGTASGDDQTSFVSPGEVLEIPIGPRLLERLVRAVDEADASEIVLGLPVNMDGSEGQRAKLSRRFAVELAAATGRPVHLQDERLTSFAAEGHLARTGRTHREKKKRRDALAAAELLRDFLESAGDGAETIRPTAAGEPGQGGKADQDG